MAAPRPFEPDDVVLLTRAATRWLGESLLINAGGAAGSVEALVGAGPELYRSFAEGMSVAAAAAKMADATAVPVDHIEPYVLDFAQGLVDAHLAFPATTP